MLYTLLLVAFPLVLVIVRPRAVVTILATAGVTWIACAWAMTQFDSDDIAAVILFIFVILPMVTVGWAMIVSTSLAPRPRMWFDAGFLSMVGWYLGILMLFMGSAIGAASVTGIAAPSLWESMQIIAAPAIWAGAGAAFGATNKPVPMPASVPVPPPASDTRD